MNSRILLVEDEPGLVLTLSDLLEAEGYQVEAAADGGSGLARAIKGGFDLVILDGMLPRKDGFEVCRELRENGSTVPVLMLTARTQVGDRVSGLRAGADDYLVKPFAPEELLARMEALLRRTRRALQQIEFGDVSIDFDRGKAQRKGLPLNLAAKELQLLRYLADRCGQTVSREELLQNVWDYATDITSRTVDVHIAWLRQKVEENPASPRYIHTVRGRGYRFIRE